jgi:hypothetical protein
VPDIALLSKRLLKTSGTPKIELAPRSKFLVITVRLILMTAWYIAELKILSKFLCELKL